jgi:hypothetical protein
VLDSKDQERWKGAKNMRTKLNKKEKVSRMLIISRNYLITERSHQPRTVILSLKNQCRNFLSWLERIKFNLFPDREELLINPINTATGSADFSLENAAEVFLERTLKGRELKVKSWDIYLPLQGGNVLDMCLSIPLQPR